MEGLRRMSPRLSGMFEAATKAVSKLTEPERDPEEDPDFVARNPTWEDQLPPIYGVSAGPTDGKAQSTAALLQALEELPRPQPQTLAAQNWKKVYKAVKKILIMRRKARQSALGTGAQMEGYSLGRWGPYNPTRLKLFTLLHNQRAEYFILGLICSHILVLIFQVKGGHARHRWTDIRDPTLDFLDGFITSLYTIEMFLKILVLGLVKGRHTYLQSPYNRLDFVIIIDSWIHIIARSVTGEDFFARIAVFRIFRGLLALKHITFFADVISIMAAVKRSVGPLQNVILLTFFLLVFYALLGTQFLQNSMNQRCVRATDNQLSYPRRYCDKKVVDGYHCPDNQRCRTYGNPNWGATTFDVLYYSLLTMFQIITLEGWSVIMYNIKDAEGERANSYFMTLVVIGTYFLCNVFIAGISGVFLRVRAEHQALLKKSRRTQTSFYNATIMANVLRDEIIRDDSQMKWYHRLINRSKRVRRDVVRVLSRTHTSMKSAFKAQSFRFSSRMGSRKLSRSLSRSMTMGVRAALTISDQSRAILEHPKFTWGMLLAVTVNAVILCLYRYGMPKDLLYVLYGMQAVLLVIFGVELVIRFLAYGPGKFASDGMNLLDVVVIAVSAGSLLSRAYPNISAVRILRWFYLSKKHTEKHPSVVATCMESVGSLFGVFFFYLLVIVVISIISMELFEGQYSRFPEGLPRASHDNMLQTMLLWFSVTTGEQWVNHMWNSMRPGVLYNGVAPFIYVFYFVLTVNIILNLIIAVLLERTELTDNEKKQIQRVEHMRLIRRMQSRAFTRSGSWVVGAIEGVKAGFGNIAYRVLSMNVRPVKTRHGGSRKRKERHSRKEDAQKDSHLPGVVSGQSEGAGIALEAASTAAAQQTSSSSEGTVGAHRRSKRSSQILQASGFPAGIAEKRGSRTALQDAVLTLADITAPPAPKFGRTVSRAFMSYGRNSKKRQSFQLSDYEELERGLTSMERPWYLQEGSLLIFGERNFIRKMCGTILNSTLYHWFALCWVIVAVWLVIELKPDGDPIFSKPILKVLHILVFVVFLVDLVMKVIYQGLIFSPDAFLGDWYNLIDIFILIIDGLNLSTWSEKSRRVIHALLAIRPFRFIVRIIGLRNLLSTLIRTLPAIFSVLLFTFAIFLIFANIGIQMFRGLFWSCNDTKVKSRAECIGYYYNSVAIYVPRVWSNPVFHFDDIGNALLSLFVCSTFDNWVTNLLYPAMDITSEDEQPSRDNSPVNALFFVAFCCVGGFFIVRVFIGVFINEFGKNSGSKLLTERQKLWRDMNRIIQKTTPVSLPKPPKTYIRRFCFHLIRNPTYQKSMIIALLGYSGFLATNVAGQPANISNRRQKAHCAISAYFLLESITKFLGDEFKVYKREFTRHMELVISLMAAAGLMGEKGTVRGYVGRTAYITRVFCIIPHIPRARVIMRTMFICLPTIAEIMALLAIFLFTFSGIGFQMFNQLSDGVCVGPTVNFKSFVNSFITVFQVLTLDNWSCIMTDAMIAPPKCTSGPSQFLNDCGYPYASVVYFVALVVVASHIFMNLFVAVILDAITFGLVNENSMVTPEHILAYRALWSQKEFDPEATGYIGLHKLRSFVDALGIPLGRRHIGAAQWLVRIEYEAISFHVPNKGIPFKELLETLTLYKIGPTGLPLSLRIEREKRIQNVYITGAATKIQGLVRGFLTRRAANAATIEGENSGSVDGTGKPAAGKSDKEAAAVRTTSMLVDTD